ncbi:hypothetical protein EDC32_10837 [Laceyella sacchari]|uniref:hypothetical protein n=1 Tax=Laceyella sacchari TaxID=37482 RepID=UPI000A8A13B7|nr:hypothetical protein [Laceyella sacchari]TCW35325.1 hypothetical protein EDC32_10837 [Laceyella sacchari]
MGYSLSYVKSFYGLDFIKRGMKVRTPKGTGTVTAAYKTYIRVRLDGEKRPDVFHPTWEMVYYGADGRVLADFRETETETF